MTDINKIILDSLTQSDGGGQMSKETDSAGKTYSDKKIEERIEQLVEKKEIVLCDIVSTGAMLQQLMGQRDEVLKDLKALELAVVKVAMSHGSEKTIAISEIGDLIHESEKYGDTGKPD